MRIEFGTDGVRGVVGKELDEDVVRDVCRAIATYLIHNVYAARERGVFVGFDTRRMSREFAEIAVDVFVKYGFRVFTSNRETPTPAVSAAVLEMGLAGAVVITASHNPPEYNGVKFIPWHGGPAEDEITSAIETIANNGYFEDCNGSGTVKTIDLMDLYLKKAVSNLERHGRKLKVVVSPMHGATWGYLSTLLKKLGHEVREIESEPDPNFGGRTPNPTAENIKPLAEEVLSWNADLGLATDGDGDRVGVVLSDGTYLDGNTAFAVLIHHMCRCEKLSSAVGRTVATTHLVDKIARSFGKKVVETPVGSKYLSKAMRNGEIEVGGEESCGYLFKWHVPDKDGIVSGAVMAEIHSVSGIERELSEIRRKFGSPKYARIDVPGRISKKAIAEKASEIARNLESIGNVSRYLTIDGLKVVFDCGSWILIRPSGTEPVTRIYVESWTDADPRDLARKVLEIVKEIISH